MQQIAINHPLGAVEFDAVVHAALLGPAIFDDGDTSILELQDDDGIVVATGALGVQDALTSGEHALGLRLAEHPARPLDAVAAHIHDGPAAGPLYIVEPV